MVKYYVYIYKNPLANYDPFYVGKGSGKRYKDHMYPCILKKDDWKSRIIQKIFATNQKPKIEILWCEDEAASFKLEKELIAKFGLKHEGGLLVNMTPGGDQPPKNEGKEHPTQGDQQIPIEEFWDNNILLNDLREEFGLHHHFMLRSIAYQVADIATGRWVVRSQPQLHWEPARPELGYYAR